MLKSKPYRARQSVDRTQLIIAEILKDDDNKYCADCDAKAPRWASWNIGVLLCIRCAGIHRGLGVHISKVKSINLDSWEPHQIMLREIGNRRGREIYEANLPEYFRRPQTDFALEQFIRAKYEQKRYIASDFIPPTPNADAVKKVTNLRIFYTDRFLTIRTKCEDSEIMVKFGKPIRIFWHANFKL
ncbi:unnamed protein product [Schistocephalus solidus]|uniref:Arf-GAP domain-containing protein n=1 Tax=Schistocephalus solidus TaxID=70667 RepID=A0A183T532_SCHSO|nr:unnamed protein product [Schistocephalus solidus]